MKRFLPSLIISLVIICYPRMAFADVLLNEFQVEPSNAQWVEIYNAGSESVDIGGWIIDDDSGTEKFVIPSGELIPANGFKVYDSNQFNLNVSSSDKVKLLHDDNLIDGYSYIKSPGGNISFGKNVDGVGEWFTYGSPTKGSSNSTATPLPTSTPMPTSVPEPSKTPTPTKAPTSTIIPSSTPVPSYTKIPTKVITPAAKKSPTPKKSTPTLVSEKQVLGDTSEKKPTITTYKELEEIEVKGSSMINPGTFLITLGGVFLLACGILLFYMKKKAKSTP